MAKAPGHPYYQRLEKVLAQGEFDRFCESQCEPYYAEVMGRPSIRPGAYFRMLIVGYLEGLDSERAMSLKYS